MEIGIFAKTFSGITVEDRLDKVIDQGIKCIQFNLVCAGLDSLPEEIPRPVAVRIGNAVKERKMKIAAVSATWNMIHPNKAVRESGFAAFREIAKSCEEMGTQLVTLCTGTRHKQNKWVGHPENNSPPAWRELLSEMERVIEMAESYNLYLGIEPEMGNVINSAEKANRLIKTLQSERIKIVFDPANLFDREAPARIRKIIARAWELLQEFVHLAHAKDRTRDGKFCAVGKGDVDFEGYMRLLNQGSYTGPLIMHGMTENEVGECYSFLNKIADSIST